MEEPGVRSGNPDFKQKKPALVRQTACSDTTRTVRCGVTTKRLKRSAPAPGISAATPEPGRWPMGAVFALVLLVTLIAYQPALTGEFLWDDMGHVTPPFLQSWSGLWRIWFEV